MSTNADALNHALAAFNEGDIDRYLDLYDDHVQVHGYTPAPLDKAGARAFYQGILTGLPDSTLEALDRIETDDTIVVRFVQRGTHRGELLGVPATGRPVELHGITILRFGDEARVVERWTQADLLGLLVQVGAIPPPG